jgi:hypothetical protein
MIMFFAISTRVRSLCTALPLVVIILLPNVAIGADKCGSLDRLMIALRFTRTLYPEVKGREFDFSFSAGHGSPLNTPTDAADIGIAIDRPTWHPPEKTSGQPDVTPQSPLTQNGDIELPMYLDFNFIVTGTGTAERQLVCRPLVFINNKMSKQMGEARTVLNAHPEWTDAEELKDATKLGMRFGPDKKAAVLKIIPWKELSTFYGPLQILDARFSINGPFDHSEKIGAFTDLRWYIYAKRVGTSRELQITIDSFTGKIDSIGETKEQ